MTLALPGFTPRTVSADANHDLQTCRNPNHWYARAISGNAPVKGGTGEWVYTPGSTYADSRSTWDEAAWSVNDNNIGDALEGGIYTGYFVYNNTWTNAVLTYMTINEGQQGKTNYIQVPRSTWVAINNYGANWVTFAWNGATQSRIYWGYSMSGPIVNLVQGEVVEGGAWMGNGSGYTNEGYWSPDGNSWYWWGWFNYCMNSPYWLDPGLGGQANNYGWIAGGY